MEEAYLQLTSFFHKSKINFKVFFKSSDKASFFQKKQKYLKDKKNPQSAGWTKSRDRKSGQRRVFLRGANEEDKKEEGNYEQIMQNLWRG